MRAGSLYRRLLTPIAMAVAVLTLLVMIAGIVFMRRAVEDRAQHRADALVPAVHDQISLAMQVGGHEHLQKVIDEIGDNPDIEALRVLRPDGVVIASSHRREIGTNGGAHLARGADRERLPRAGFWSVGPIHALQSIPNGPSCHRCHGAAVEVLGLLDLDVLVNPHMTGLTTFGSLSVLLGVLYLVAVVGIVVPTLGYVVVRPMRAVIAGLRRVQRGDLQTRLQPAGAGELDEVIDGFNQMVAQLESARAVQEEKLRLERAHAEHIASVGQMATGLAHEFRNPISSVKAVVEVLAEESAPGDPNREVLRAAARELDRVDTILRDLLHYARPRQPAKAPFDLNDIVSDVARITFPFAEGGPSMEFALDGAVPTLCGDADMVRQVLMNLLLNAGQAVPPDGAGRVRIQTGVNGTQAWCCVADNGPGITADHAATLFRPFVTTKARGTGLGLATSRRLAELIGGSLVLENPGRPGASFRFTIPLDMGCA